MDVFSERTTEIKKKNYLEKIFESHFDISSVNRTSPYSTLFDFIGYPLLLRK